eukprot:CAMPEP_0119018304 /NCGR_PEP_ID=MMETSP1176-20130426/19028_1 /TAXON_ID=265551 /ORGANISM="Synedropsis recta cf, Strain CCMP1620" /LENGTH=207 /DNA_ID=CAMNT_0006972269 /DNA_START=16 /DNA_END=639 /DNA_ORIENTATION=-
MRVLLLIAALLAVESFTMPSPSCSSIRRPSLFTGVLLRVSTDDADATDDKPSKDDADETSTLMSMIEKRDIFIQNLETQLDDMEVELREKKSLLSKHDTKLSESEAETKEQSSMLTKRDTLIENLEEEIIELENQLKSAGKFQEKKPPMKGRKFVGDEGDDDDWQDPLQNIQGSLLFHFAMTIRLTLVTVFYRIPRFIINLPKRFLK